MYLELPTVNLNKETVLRDVKFKAESLSRFRLKATTASGGEVDIAVVSINYTLNGLKPSARISGYNMINNKQFEIHVSISVLTKEMKMSLTYNDITREYNNTSISQSIKSFIKLISL